MRKEYRKAVRQLFTAAMKESAPGHVPLEVDSPLLFSGETVFGRVVDGLATYVLLVPDARGHQAFTVELAWSASERFPEIGMRPSLMLGPDDDDPIDVEEAVVRLGDLAFREDRWWRLPDPAVEHPGSIEALQKGMDKIPPETALEDAREPVADAVEALAEHGLPFLERWRMRRGSED